MNTLLEVLRASTQLMTYTIFIGGGAVYLLISWVLGHFGADHDVDHDHADLAHPDSGHATVSIFSPKVLALFAIGLGAGGTLSTINGYGPLGSALWGLGSGLGLGALMLLFMRMLYGQQASSDLNIGSAIGKLGEVVIDIPAGGTGEIGITVSGQYASLFARAKNNTAVIRRGSAVRVLSVSGSTLIVEQQ